MESKSRILVTGSTGLVGAALVKELFFQYPDATIFTPRRTQLDLLDRQETYKYFAYYNVEYVFHCAGKVGGINANEAHPVEFLDDNYLMTSNLLFACFHTTVKKICLPGSSCMYPKYCAQPMKESYLGTGQLEPTNEGYALAKIASLKLAESYHTQYGLLTVNPILTNIYGDNDHYNEASHVIPAMIKKFVDAKEQKLPSVKFRGTGEQYREFLHNSDAARALILCMEKMVTPKPVNVGSDTEVNIQELAKTISAIVKYSGEVLWDSHQDGGMQRKLLDSSLIQLMGFRPQMPLFAGLCHSVTDYVQRRKAGEFR